MNTYLTPDQVCEKLQIAKQTLYLLTSRKEIPFTKIGKVLRFDESAIENWFREKSASGISTASEQERQALI